MSTIALLLAYFSSCSRCCEKWVRALRMVRWHTDLDLMNCRLYSSRLPPFVGLLFGFDSIRTPVIEPWLIRVLVFGSSGRYEKVQLWHDWFCLSRSFMQYQHYDPLKGRASQLQIRKSTYMYHPVTFVMQPDFVLARKWRKWGRDPVWNSFHPFQFWRGLLQVDGGCWVCQSQMQIHHGHDIIDAIVSRWRRIHTEHEYHAAR